MRAAIVAAVLAATAALLTLACTEDSTPAIGSDPDGGGTGSSSSSGGSSPGDAATITETDARAPTGCLLSTTGFVEGKKAEVVARTDVQNTASWTNVDRALAADGQFATVTLAAGQESSKLRVSDFGLSIPDTAETWGIEVELKRRAPDGGVEDQQINIEVEGKPSRYKLVDGPWPTTIVGTHAYGQAIDTWGVDMFPADVNKASFAATLTVKRAANATGPVTAVVDSLRVAVHFCKEPVKK